VDLDIGISFIVLKADVVFWAMFLDQVHLEDERLKFGPNDNPLNVYDLAHKAPRFRIVTGIRVKI
jgi:hypothetical protein